MLSKRAGVTVLVLFLTAAAIAAYIGTSLLMPASAHPNPPPTVPERPTGISISQDENGVTLQWDDPGDKSVTRYRIVRTMIQDGRPVLTSITDWRDRGKQFYTDSRALPSRTYTYQIWAMNAIGKSEGSDVITVRTPADTQGTTTPPGSSTVREPRSDTPGAPGAPSLYFIFTETTTIRILWYAPTDTGTSPITGYNIRYKEANAPTWNTTITGVSGVTHVQGLNQTIRNLRSNTEYHAGVQAVNSSGPGHWSNSLRAWTDPITPPNRRPGFSDSSYTRTVAENTGPGQDIGSAITATDPDANPITYSIYGTDASAFTVASRGQLETSDLLNFESRNNYQFTIQAKDSRGAIAIASVTVAVEDVQERGSVTISPAPAIIHQQLTATLEDEDERTSQASWQWAWANSSTGLWANISGETDSTYTPVPADQGKHLRATAEYDDINPNQSAEATVGPVRDPTLESLTVSPRDIDGFHPARFDYAVGVDHTVSPVTVTAQASNPLATLTYSTTDASGSTGHQVDLASGINTLTITVSDGDLDKTYTITIGRGVTAEYGWKAQDDLNTLIAAENLSPQGLWSDGATMWLADSEDGKLYAYNLNTKAREPGRDITLDPTKPHAPGGVEQRHDNLGGRRHPGEAPGLSPLRHRRHPGVQPPRPQRRPLGDMVGRHRSLGAGPQ